MSIRKFQPSDLEAVLQLFYDVVHTTGAKYYSLEEVNAWAPEKRTDKEAWLKSLSNNMTYVVEVDGKIVGFGDMTKTGYIDRLYVHKNFQGQGVARSLLRKFEEEAHRLGLKEMTTEANMIARPLAERHGFVVISEKRKIRRGSEFVNYMMRKKLL